MTHPVVSAIEQRRVDIGMTVKDLAARAGLDRDTVQHWRINGPHRTPTPTLANAEAALNVLGLRLAVEPIDAEPIPFIRRRQ